MLTVKNLADEFGVFQTIAKNIFQARESTAAHEYNYWISTSSSQDLVVVAEDVCDQDTAIIILDSVPPSLKHGRPSLFPLGVNKYGFTHILAVPGDYHGYMKDYGNIKRDSFFLCVPICRYEFSGDESASEFRAMNVSIVSILNWHRLTVPKTIMYFDNPKTGSGTTDSVVVRYEALLSEIKNLNGVANGFIEVTNYKDNVIEILSPSAEQYNLLRNRVDSELKDINELVASVHEFLTD